MDLHEVNVLGITSLRLQVKLVQGGSAAPREFLGQKWIGENLHNRTADYEVLLDSDVESPAVIFSKKENCIPSKGNSPLVRSKEFMI